MKSISLVLWDQFLSFREVAGLLAIEDVLQRRPGGRRSVNDRWTWANLYGVSDRPIAPHSQRAIKYNPAGWRIHGESRERELSQCGSAAESIRANNVDLDVFCAGVFRTQELCGDNCVSSVFSGTLGFDPEDSAS